MPASALTTGDLLAQSLVIEDDLTAAVNAYLTDPSTTRQFPLGAAYTLNLIAAVRVHKYVGRTLDDPDASDSLKRAAVRKAILLAQPEKR
jgi:hypothetical protein